MATFQLTRILPSVGLLKWVTAFLARSLSKSCRFFDFRWFRPLASISWCWAVPFAPVVLLVHVFNDCPFVADHRERCCLLICSSSILKEQIRSSIRLICYLPPLYPIVTFLKAFTKMASITSLSKLSSGSVDVWLLYPSPTSSLRHHRFQGDPSTRTFLDIRFDDPPVCRLPQIAVEDFLWGPSCSNFGQGWKSNMRQCALEEALLFGIWLDDLLDDLWSTDIIRDSLSRGMFKEEQEG